MENSSLVDNPLPVKSTTEHNWSTRLYFWEPPCSDRSPPFLNSFPRLLPWDTWNGAALAYDPPKAVSAADKSPPTSGGVEDWESPSTLSSSW